MVEESLEAEMTSLRKQVLSLKVLLLVVPVVGLVIALAAGLTPPRAIWVMVPAGDPTESTVASLAGLLSADDVVIDGGYSCP